MGLERGLESRDPRPVECLRAIAGVLTGVVCWEEGVDTVPPCCEDTGTDDMDMDMMSRPPGPELRRGELLADLRSVELDLGKVA